MGSPSVLSIHADADAAEDGLLTDGAVCRELGCGFRPVATCRVRAAADGTLEAEPAAIDEIRRRFERALEPSPPSACRLGLLAGVSQIEWAAQTLRRHRLPGVVLTPILLSIRSPLSDPAAPSLLLEAVGPLCRVVVLRAADARAFGGERIADVEDLVRVAGILRRRGPVAVLISGLIRRGRVIDVLDDDGRVGVMDVNQIRAPRIEGLSGAHAMALTCQLARGASMRDAALNAQRYVASRLDRRG